MISNFKCKSIEKALNKLRDLFINMQAKINPANNYLVFDLFKFFVASEDQKIYISKTVSPNFIYAMNEILNNSYRFIYFDEEISVCPECGAHLNNNGTQIFNLNKNLKIYKQTYSCSNKNAILQK